MATVEKRGDSYRITVSAGYNTQGKQIKKRMTWKPAPTMTQRQTEKELDRQAVLFEDSILKGKALGGAIKLQDFIEQWFDDYAAANLRNLTIQRYRQLTPRIYQNLGHIRIDRIQPHHLIAFYQELGQIFVSAGNKRNAKTNFKTFLKAQNLSYNELSEKSGVSLRTVKAAACGENISDKTVLAISKALGVSETTLFTIEGKPERKLAPKTIRHYHTFLSSVMERAVKWGLIDSNPCHRVDAPKTDKKETRCLTAQEAAQFLENLSQEALDIQVMFSMLLLTGVRRGELLGLEWSDIDFDNETITIKRTSQYTADKGIYTDTTKTEQSKRIISIPHILIILLSDYKREMLRKRFALGSQWVNSNRLFVKWNGEPMHPNTPYALLHKLLNKYDLPLVSLHSLRHTNASIMIANGADIRTVSGRLGHSQTSTTLNIYAHLLQDADERAADIVSDVLYKRA